MENNQIKIFSLEKEIFLYKNYLIEKNLSKETIRTYSENAKRFLLFCIKNNESKIDKIIFIKFVQNKQELLKANSLRIKYISTIQYAKFKKMDFVIELKNNFKLPQLFQTPKFVVNKIEIGLILEKFNLKKFYQMKKFLWIKILFETGLRAFEFQKLKKSDISNNFLKIVGKGRKERIVFITPELKELMLKWPFEFFCTNKNGKVITIKHLRNLIKSIGIKNGYSGSSSITPHTLRRSFCTNLIKNGCNLKIVQNLMGHNSISTTSKYIFFNEKEMYQEYLRYI